MKSYNALSKKELKFIIICAYDDCNICKKIQYQALITEECYYDDWPIGVFLAKCVHWQDIFCAPVSVGFNMHEIRRGSRSVHKASSETGGGFSLQGCWKVRLLWLGLEFSKILKLKNFSWLQPGFVFHVKRSQRTFFFRLSRRHERNLNLGLFR